MQLIKPKKWLKKLKEYIKKKNEERKEWEKTMREHKKNRYTHPSRIRQGLEDTRYEGAASAVHDFLDRKKSEAAAAAAAAAVAESSKRKGSLASLKDFVADSVIVIKEAIEDSATSIKESLRGASSSPPSAPPSLSRPPPPSSPPPPIPVQKTVESGSEGGGLKTSIKEGLKSSVASVAETLRKSFSEPSDPAPAPAGIPPPPPGEPPIIHVTSVSPDNTKDTLCLLWQYVKEDLKRGLMYAKANFNQIRSWFASKIDPYSADNNPAKVDSSGVLFLSMGVGMLSTAANMNMNMLRANPADVVPLRIGLAQRNVDLAAGYLLDVSDPKSVNYGKHWSAQKVAETFAPSSETVNQVVKWLGDSGIESERLGLSAGLNWILLNATVDEAEHLLDTKYYHYLYPEGAASRIGSEGYKLPESVKNYIDIIIPTTSYEDVQPIPQQVVGPAAQHLDGLAGLEACQSLITIECLRHLYKFGPGNSSTPGNEVGIAQWGGNSLGAQADLDLFFQNFTTQPIPASTAPELVSIVNDGFGSSVGSGTNKALDPLLEEIQSLMGSSESALDVQTAYSIVYPQGVRLYQVGSDPSEAQTSNFDTFIDSLVGDGSGVGAPLSKVLSFSYLQTEADLPAEYQRRQCIEWLKLGLQGVSVLCASGDAGVANRELLSGGDGAFSDDKITCLDGPDGQRFSPSFPANCPWVTAVGATSLRSKGVSDGEVALDIPSPKPAAGQDIFSGGGFSNVFDRPTYQEKAVSFYLDKYTPPYESTVFNRYGRGFPDISALGHNISVVVDGQVQRGGGTSASTPIVAGLVTLLNEERFAAGKGALGFLNPVLYAHPEAFNDVVEGSNPGCGTDGFKAAPGWDPVTGLGTPDYGRLREIVLALP